MWRDRTRTVCVLSVPWIIYVLLFVILRSIGLRQKLGCFQKSCIFAFGFVKKTDLFDIYVQVVLNFVNFSNAGDRTLHNL